jgi:hypothetical protein
MIDALATPRSQQITLALVGLFAAFVASALLAGVSDNPPGIALAALAASALVLAFVHPWRSVRKFVGLAAGSVLGFMVLVVVHNLLGGVAELSSVGGVPRVLVEAVGVAAFLTAVLLCPVAFVIGVLGSAAMFVRSRRQASDARTRVAPTDAR